MGKQEKWSLAFSQTTSCDVCGSSHLFWLPFDSSQTWCRYLQRSLPRLHVFDSPISALSAFWSLKLPGQFPLDFLTKTYGKSIKIQPELLYSSSLKSMGNQLKWSLMPPGSIPLHLLLKIRRKTIKVEPEASRVDSSISPYSNQWKINRTFQRTLQRKPPED